MKYRLLKDKDKFYPQRRKKFGLKWNYYGNKIYAKNVNEAVDIIELYKKEERYIKHPSLYVVLILLFIFIVIGGLYLFLSKTGMI